jgi:GTP-binding protein
MPATRRPIADLPTPKLTRALIDAVARQAPPRSGLFRPKLRYAHQGGSNPPLIVIHGNALDKIPESYRRYLEHTFREVFKLQGTPLQIQFNVSSNPFADKTSARAEPAQAEAGGEASAGQKRAKPKPGAGASFGATKPNPAALA